MTKVAERLASLRDLIQAGPLVLPGAYNALTARLIERVGFQAVYVSGAGLANATAGVPDIGLLELDEVVRLAGYIAHAVSVPVLCDADTGFGDASDAARMVQAFEQAGISGIHIEDQEFPKRCGHLGGKTLVPAEEMAEKIKAAIGARATGDFLLVARTDARAVEGYDKAVERARQYLTAGADAIFPEALESVEELRRFAIDVKAPLLANMTEFGKGPLLSARELFDMGYRMVIFPQSALRVSMKSSEQFLRDLHETGDQRSWLERMQTRQELYDLLGYDPSNESWPD